VIDYIKIVLNDYTITDKERINVSNLKRYFRVQEGDFYKYRKVEVIEIMHRQLDKIYEFGVIPDEESVHRFEVQDLFDISYDQFLEIKKLYLSIHNSILFNEFKIKEEDFFNVSELEEEKFDSFFDEAAREVVSKQQGNTSFLQRKFKLGYNRAERIMNQLEREKIVGISIGSKSREVLIKSMDTLEDFLKTKELSENNKEIQEEQKPNEVQENEEIIEDTEENQITEIQEQQEDNIPEINNIKKNNSDLFMGCSFILTFIFSIAVFSFGNNLLKILSPIPVILFCISMIIWKINKNKNN